VRAYTVAKKAAAHVVTDEALSFYLSAAAFAIASAAAF